MAWLEDRPAEKGARREGVGVMPFGLAMEITLPFPLPHLRNPPRPCSFTGALSYSPAKPGAFRARTGAIRSLNSKEVPRAYGL